MIASSCRASVPALAALKEFMAEHKGRTGAWTPEGLFDANTIMAKVRKQGIIIIEEER